MGQYHYVINLDKKQYLHPHRFGDGLKLLEFGDSAGGTMTALAILLAESNDRGGGDLHSSNPIIGTWAGDRIIISGDYADDAPGHDRNWFAIARDEFVEISGMVIAAMKDDEYLHEQLKQRITYR